MNSLRSVCLLIVGIVLTGCETPRPVHVERYVNNPSTLEVLLENPGSQLSVGTMDNGVGIGKALKCLNEEIPLPDSVTLADYIRSGLIAELSNARHFDPNAINSISGIVVAAELNFERRVMYAAHHIMSLL